MAAPGRVALGLATGTLAGNATEKGLEAAGVPPGYSELAGDVAGVASGASAAADAPKLAPWLSKSAQKNYLSVLAPSSPRAVPKAEATAAGLAEQKPVALTRGGLLEQAKQRKAAAGPAAGAAYSNKPAVNPEQIFTDLEDLRGKYATVEGPNGPVVVNPAANAFIDGLRDNLNALRDELGNIPAKALDDYRDQLFRGIVDSKGNVRAMTPASTARLQTAAANSIRSLLDGQFPDSKAVNDTFKLWSSTASFLEDARRRAVVSDTRGTGVAGQLIQQYIPRPLRVIPRGVLGVFDSVAWNTVSGAVKQSVATALAKGDWKRAEFLMRGPAGAQYRMRQQQPSPETGELAAEGAAAR